MTLTIIVGLLIMGVPFTAFMIYRDGVAVAAKVWGVVIAISAWCWIAVIAAIKITGGN